MLRVVTIETWRERTLQIQRKTGARNRQNTRKYVKAGCTAVEKIRGARKF